MNGPRIPKVFKSLVRDLRAGGYLIQRGRGGHLHVLTAEGKFVYAMASTCGDVKAHLAVRTALRKRGVHV